MQHRSHAQRGVGKPFARCPASAAPPPPAAACCGSARAAGVLRRRTAAAARTRARRRRPRAAGAPPPPAMAAPYRVDLDADAARRLAAGGGTLLLLGVPPGTLLGLDQQAFVVGPRFQGVKMVPPGVHFLSCQAVARDGTAAPAVSTFLDVAARGVVLRRWDPAIEGLAPVADEDEVGHAAAAVAAAAGGGACWLRRTARSVVCARAGAERVRARGGANVPPLPPGGALRGGRAALRLRRRTRALRPRGLRGLARPHLLRRHRHAQTPAAGEGGGGACAAHAQPQLPLARCRSAAAPPAHVPAMPHSFAPPPPGRRRAERDGRGAGPGAVGAPHRRGARTGAAASGGPRAHAAAARRQRRRRRRGGRRRRAARRGGARRRRGVHVGRGRRRRRRRSGGGGRQAALGPLLLHAAAAGGQGARRQRRGADGAQPRQDVCP